MYSNLINDLEMKVKDVDDMGENWQTNLFCQRTGVQKLTLLGSNGCSR